jgi:hypothetical protein
MSTTEEEKRAYGVKRETCAHGRNTITFDCPFCGLETTAYLWSLAGSGKRCPCGAKHGNGDSVKVTKAT